MLVTHRYLLTQFCKRHPEANAAISRWENVMQGFLFTSYNELHTVLRSADYVAPFTVFNVGGNNYRIISMIDYPTRTVRIRAVLTHSEYDKWTKQFQRGQFKK